MQLIEQEKDYSVNKTEMLKNMPISKTTALKVDQADAASVRTLISNLHRSTDLRYETAKTATGINVWRTA